MRKLLIFFSLWLGVATGVVAAENFTLADGTAVSGDIVSSDPVGVMIHTTLDAYTPYQWTNFSQDSLKQLAANPKYRGYASAFIEPSAADRPQRPQVNVKPADRMTLPEHPSILGGMTGSSVGVFILLVLFGANLYAAYEVAVVRNRPIGLVMVVAAVLPVIGPAIFIFQPAVEREDEQVPTEDFLPEEPAPGGGAPAAQPASRPASSAPTTRSAPPRSAEPEMEEIQIVSASWSENQTEEKKKPQPQVYARGKYTLNKRFIETRFGNYIGEIKGDAKNFTMSVKTLKDTLQVESIKQVGATEIILETPYGQTTVGFGDLQEIKLTPKPV